MELEIENGFKRERKKDKGEDLEERENVYFRGNGFSLNHHHLVGLKAGRIYVKTIAEEDKKDKYNDLIPVSDSKWHLLGKNGLPKKGYFTNGHNLIQWPSGWYPFGFVPPKKIIDVDSDGDSIVAIGNNRVIYWMRWKHGFQEYWQARWGLTLPQILPTFVTGLNFDLGFPSWIYLPRNIRSWAISRRYRYNDYYEDIDGTQCPTDIGVTTLFILLKNGYEIKYVDPWLCPKFKHRVDTPLRGRFICASMSVAASTLFVIGQNGDMFTRLIDFDTAGHNPFLQYTWKREREEGEGLHHERYGEEETMLENQIIDNERKGEIKRRLPNEGWKRQPPPLQAKRLSSWITILQRGKGNGARELRVYGEDNEGNFGFFTKPIFAAMWSFHHDEKREISPPSSEDVWLSWESPLGRVKTPEILMTSEDEDGFYDGVFGPCWDIPLEGRNYNLGGKEDGFLQILDFNPYSSPCHLTIQGNEGMRLPVSLHLLAPEEDDEEGHLSHWNGVLVVHEEFMVVESSAQIVREWLGGHDVIEVDVRVATDKKKNRSFLTIQSKELTLIEKYIQWKQPRINWTLSLGDVIISDISHVLLRINWVH